MRISKRIFGKTPEGQEAYMYTLSNSNGMKAEITNFGGTVVSLFVPNKDGKLDDVVLGYDNIEDYIKKGPYFGALIGRYANRISGSSFILNDIEYTLYKNEGENHLHGGLKGFDKVLWQAEILSTTFGEVLKLTYRSVDGEEGYPGNLDITVKYSVTSDNALVIDLFAATDQDTIVNLTNHSYFNLSGHSSGDVLNHCIQINSEKFTVVDSKSIPTGEIRYVSDTPMDFTRAKPIGESIYSSYEQTQFGNGYDHNWVLDKGDTRVSGAEPEKAAEVFDPASGRCMEVFTNKPGVQFYTGNFLDGSEIGKGGVRYQKRNGFCLETQFYPDSLKHTNFPTPILKPGQEYKYMTIYKFK